MEKFLKKYQWLIMAAIIIFFLVVSILNAKNDGITYDEVAHIPAGYSYLTQHEMRLNPEHPPLLKNLSAIPLLFLDINFNTTQDFWTKDNVADNQWNAGRNLLYHSGNDADKIIFWSRIPLIILSLALGLFIFFWTKKISTTTAAFMAFILFSFSPNVLGHNHLVTTDVGIAAFIVFAFYFFIKFIKNPSWKNVLWAGIFLGLLQLAKFSAVMTFPILFLLTIFYPFFKKEQIERAKIKILGEYIFKGILVFVISLVMVWALYYFNTYNMPKEQIDNAINYYFHFDDPNIKTIYARKILFAINEYPLLQPMGEYLFGVMRVFQRVAGGNVTYFMHNVSSKASKAYFPLVFLIKEPLPILFLTLFSLIAFFRNTIIAFYAATKKSSSENLDIFSKFVRHRLTEITMFTFVILYSATSIFGNLNIGFRHLFPLIPFVYILVAKKISDFQKEHTNKRVFTLLMTIILCLWLIVETLISYPYYISYFNQTVGGPKNGYEYVTDSNADWGQDIKRLQEYLNQHPEIEKIRVNYFGGGDAEYYLGEDRIISWWDTKRPIENGWYAISVLFIQESLYDQKKSSEENYNWLKKYTPIAQIGTSILIYHIDDIE
ncbi:MAG: 4-amino-4-deoxy-L-arabinose transferase [uncultured bacterium]|nr:MAG: 4-amino-4-deoxy-L-arabinose transferase [uncultured bacterium]HBR71215.1 hypothetical protein [Candidatus Moranbacteria bacterium]